MDKSLCPKCGCEIKKGEGYEKEGLLYCCEPCGEGTGCECGCCKVVNREEEEAEAK